MKIILRHTVIALAAVMILFASCRRDEAEVIPRKKLAEIYAEMLLTDQWINSNYGVRQIADTSLVYEPILKKYGYDSKDYRRSIDKYMDDPERFAKIFKTTCDILDERMADLRRRQKLEEARARLPKFKTDFKVEDFTKYFSGEPYVHYYDSISVVQDSASRIYRIVPVERTDTVYDGVRMIVADSLMVADSLAKMDSLDVDSLKIDSLKVDLPKRDSSRIDTSKKIEFKKWVK